MLQITIPAKVLEEFDEENSEFVYTTISEEQTLQLEHSLVSLSKWESKWCKPFLSLKDKTGEESLDYVKCMTLNPNVPDDVYDRLTQANMDEIHKYINAPMTATTFSDDKNGKGGREIVTAEIIYYWMVALTIPFKCEEWHLNKLIALIRTCNAKNKDPKKMNQKDIMRQNAKLNSARRKRLNSRG